MSVSSNEVLVVLCTFPNLEEAGNVARTLVGERLCACVNLVPQIHSIYQWQGEIVSTGEVLGIIKTTPARYEALSARIHELHTYEVPEVVALPAAAVSQGYLRWVKDETETP